MLTQSTFSPLMAHESSVQMDSEFDSTHPVYAPAASSGLPSGPQSDDPTTMHTLHPSEVSDDVMMP